MKRLTEMRGDDVLYIGKHARLVELGETASTMRVAATRDVLQRLAEYEATGLTPEEVAELVEQTKPVVITMDGLPPMPDLQHIKKPQRRAHGLR